MAKYNNKVIIGTQTIMDLTKDTVSAADVMTGKTAHDKSGASITGTIADNGAMDLTIKDANGVTIPEGYTKGGTVKLDSNAISDLKPENIAKGSTILGVTGTSVSGTPLDFYPVGSMYFTIDASFDPGTTWGGTWERLTDHYVRLAGDNYPAGSIGGANTHKITIDEMPAHTHTVVLDGVRKRDLSSSIAGSSGPVYSGTQTVTTTSTGGGKAITVSPNYYSVIGWRRTA